MPTCSAPLKGVRAPSCMWSQSAACVCYYRCGREASLAGLPAADIDKLPTTGRTDREIYDDYMRCFPEHRDPSVEGNKHAMKQHVQRVATGLKAAAAAFDCVPEHTRDAWSMQVLNDMPASERARFFRTHSCT